MISDETIKKLTENNKKISDLLKENEDLLKKEGLDVPKENYSLDKDKKIKIPAGYIRFNELFQEKYKLESIVKKKETQKNIAYLFQLSDFFNYVINRFNVWGSVETMLYKTAIVNFVSILEALIFECANNICKPRNCQKIKTCPNHFSKNQRSISFEALKKLNELGITDFSDDELKRIKYIIDLRNKIHIRLSERNEYISSEFSLSLYNELIGLLQKLSERIYNYGVPLYNQCVKEV